MDEIRYYLDENGLVELINYIKLQLAEKVNADELGDYIVKEDLNELIAKVEQTFKDKGSVAEKTDLDNLEPEIGDVYTIEESHENYTWDGTQWKPFGTAVDTTGFVKEEELEAISREELYAILYDSAVDTVSDVAGIEAMIANNTTSYITLNNDLELTSSINIPEGKTVKLNLNDKTITSNTPVAVISGGKIDIENGSIEMTQSADAIIATNNGEITLTNTNITSKRNGVSVKNGSKVTFNSGKITSQEAGILGLKNSSIIVNGGEIEGIDNAPIMGNGTAPGLPNDGSNLNVVMNGGTLKGHIKSSGYIACGVYIPNSGTFTMNDGVIESDGVGLVMRGGSVSLNGGSIIANGVTSYKGKVGDSRIVVGPYAVVYDAAAKYPMAHTLQLTIEKGMILQGTNGDIDTILDEGQTANIIDKR